MSLFSGKILMDIQTGKVNDVALRTYVKVTSASSLDYIPSVLVHNGEKQKSKLANLAYRMRTLFPFKSTWSMPSLLSDMVKKRLLV